MSEKTRLSQVVNGAPIASFATRMAAKLVNGRRGEDVNLPVLGPARVEILGAVETQEVESSVYKAMAAHEIEQNVITVDRFELERAYRTLARSVRDPEDKSKVFGTVDEWGALDNDVIVAAWQVYGDVRERLDPLSTPLTADERVMIEIAVKKKDAVLLRTFGTVKLCAWLASTDVLPSTSPPPSSPSSESSSDS